MSMEQIARDIREGTFPKKSEATLREEEIVRLREFVGWVDSWVSNPVGAYSVAALDGLFGMTRDKIAALTPAEGKTL